MTRPFEILFTLAFFVLLCLSLATWQVEVWQRTKFQASALSSGEFLALSDEATTTKQYNPQSIIFVGDVFLGRNVETLMQKTATPSYPFQGLVLPSSTALAVGNFEAAVPTKHQKTPDFTFRFSVAKDLLIGAEQFGFTHFGLANNHSNDFGPSGFTATQNNLVRAGFTTFGSPTNDSSYLRADVALNDVTLALFALNAFDGEIREEEVKEALTGATTTYQIVYVHWGDEYKNQHNLKQEQLARFLIESGADAVIGHHPHVVQDIAIYDGVPVFYSLGNYIFDQYFSPAVQTGLLLTSQPTKSGLGFSLRTVESQSVRSQPRFLPAIANQKYLQELAERSPDWPQTGNTSLALTNDFSLQKPAN